LLGAITSTAVAKINESAILDVFLVTGRQAREQSQCFRPRLFLFAFPLSTGHTYLSSAIFIYKPCSCGQARPTLGLERDTPGDNKLSGRIRDRPKGMCGGIPRTTARRNFSSATAKELGVSVKDLL